VLISWKVRRSVSNAPQLLDSVRYDRKVSASRRVARSFARRVPEPLIRFVGRHQRLPVMRKIGRYARALLSVDGVVPHGEAAGLLFNAAGGNAGFALGTSEPEVQRTFAALVEPGKIVYDVGAASGFYTVIAARRVTDRGCVVAFEPRPDNASRIRHNVALNQFRHVKVLELALGDKDGEASFSLGADANRGGLTDVHVEPGSGGMIRVRTATIDKLVGEAEIPPPDVIKMDIEGAEIEALLGAKRTVLTHRPALLIEVHGRGAKLRATLDHFGYVARVLERNVSLSEAEWGTHILATTKESTT
jgi:FkbM family methyltransferase